MIRVGSIAPTRTRIRIRTRARARIRIRTRDGETNHRPSAIVVRASRPQYGNSRSASRSLVPMSRFNGMSSRPLRLCGSYLGPSFSEARE